MPREENHTKSPHVLSNAGSEPVAMPVALAVEIQPPTAIPDATAIPLVNAVPVESTSKINFPSLIIAIQQAATRYEAFLNSWCSMSLFSVRNEGKKRLNEIKYLLGMPEKSISDVASQDTDSQVVNALANIINSSSSVFKGYLADSIFHGSVCSLEGYKKGCVSSSVVTLGWLEAHVHECIDYQPAHIIGSYNLNKNALMDRLLVSANKQLGIQTHSRRLSQ